MQRGLLFQPLSHRSKEVATFSRESKRSCTRREDTSILLLLVSLFPWMASRDRHENGASTFRDHPWRTALVISQFHSGFLSPPRPATKETIVPPPPVILGRRQFFWQPKLAWVPRLCVIIDRFRMSADAWMLDKFLVWHVSRHFNRDLYLNIHWLLDRNIRNRRYILVQFVSTNFVLMIENLWLQLAILSHSVSVNKFF